MSDLIDRLMKAGINDLHPRVAEGLRHHFRPSIMTIQTRLGDQDTNFLFHLVTPLESLLLALHAAKRGTVRDLPQGIKRFLFRKNRGFMPRVTLPIRRLCHN